MYRCAECGELFDEPKKALLDRHTEITGCVEEYYHVSPCCESDIYEEVYPCFRCGTYSEYTICDECIRKDMSHEFISDYISIYDLWDDFLLGFYCKTSQKPSDKLREITMLSFGTLNKKQQTEALKKYAESRFASYAKWYRETL